MDGESKRHRRRVTSCATLYLLALDFCISRMEKSIGGRGETDSESQKVLESLGGSIAEDLLLRAFRLANGEKPNVSKVWKDAWKMFFTSKVSSVILSWEEDLIEHVRRNCQRLKEVRVVHVKELRPALIRKCPPTVVTVDFDGELVDRGKCDNFLRFVQETPSWWISDSEKILRSLAGYFSKSSEYSTSPGTSGLCELHFGNVPVTPDELGEIVRACRNLRFLRHYNLASALYKLHSEAWRRKESLPVYELTNLDADFSHVVRCRMSPEWVLSPDALHLAAILCPRAKIIRIRFDCSTPHDVLAPLTQLRCIKEFGVVCVSSGERSLVDFSDLAPIIEKYGAEELTHLELKVIEEVEIHVITENCRKLECLVLSGCGYVTPPSCNIRGCPSVGSLNGLRLLFYSDGDDFGWDSGVPECFWRAALLPSCANPEVRLRGLFLEYPRMGRALTSSIFSPKGRRCPPFPNLMAASFSRFEEITVEDVESLCGVVYDSPCEPLRYLRLSDCDKIKGIHRRRLETRLKGSPFRDLRLHMDG